MLYLIAVLFPPGALLGAGKPGQAFFSLLLMVTIIGWIPAIIWAVMVVNQRNAERRHKAALAAQEAAIQQQTAALLAAQQDITLPVPPTTDPELADLPT